MNALDTRLKIMNINTAEMTEEEKWTAGTGLTFIPEDTDKNEDWYVPSGAGNVLSEDEDQDTTEDTEQGDDTEGDDTPEQVDPQPDEEQIPEEKLEEDDEEPKDTEETKENEGPASDITVETQE